MKLFVFLIFSLTHLSKALLLPLNSTALQLRPQDTTITTGEANTNNSLIYDPWPILPYQRTIHDGLIIRITAYGGLMGKRYTTNVLQALIGMQRFILHSGEWFDVLEEITVVGDLVGDIYTEIGFYSLLPPLGITTSQAGEVLQAICLLVREFGPAKEIASSTVLADGIELALFRLSFRRQS